jgi:succinate dehydrogenase/fumarate reductase-like Fe-S protein
VGINQKSARFYSSAYSVHSEFKWFGGCTNIGECTAACPKEISQEFIARMNRDYLKAKLT